MASVFPKIFYFHFDGVLLEVSRLVINKIMSGRFYDVITSLCHISRRLSVEIKRKQKQWGNQKICHHFRCENYHYTKL